MIQHVPGTAGTWAGGSVRSAGACPEPLAGPPSRPEATGPLQCSPELGVSGVQTHGHDPRVHT